MGCTDQAVYIDIFHINSFARLYCIKIHAAMAEESRMWNCDRNRNCNFPATLTDGHMEGTAMTVCTNENRLQGL